MKYYAQYNELGELISIGIGGGGTEITKAEYDALLYEIRAKADLEIKLYEGEITIAEVPEEWREEIRRRVNERIEEEAAEEERELSAEEALSIILGGAV